MQFRLGSQLGKSGCKIRGRERLCRGQRPHLGTRKGTRLGRAALLPWAWVDADCSVLPPAGHVWKHHFTPGNSTLLPRATYPFAEFPTVSSVGSFCQAFPLMERTYFPSLPRQDCQKTPLLWPKTGLLCSPTGSVSGRGWRDDLSLCLAFLCLLPRLSGNRGLAVIRESI